MTMRPTKKTPSQILSTASLEDVLQCLVHVQKRRALAEVLQGLLQTRLARLTSSDAPAPTPDELLTVPDVARVLKVSRPRAYELARQGMLPSVRIGQKQVRVRRRDLTEYLQKASKNACK